MGTPTGRCWFCCPHHSPFVANINTSPEDHPHSWRSTGRATPLSPCVIVSWKLGTLQDSEWRLVFGWCNGNLTKGLSYKGINVPRSGSTTNNLRITHYHSLTNLSLSNIFNAHLRFLTTGSELRVGYICIPTELKRCKVFKEIRNID